MSTYREAMEQLMAEAESANPAGGAGAPSGEAWEQFIAEAVAAMEDELAHPGDGEGTKSDQTH